MFRYVGSVFATLSLGYLLGGCSAGGVSRAAASAVSEVDSKSIFASVVSMDTAAKQQLFSQLKAMSFETYYKFIASQLDNEAVTIDRKTVSGLKNQWIAGHADLTKLGQHYGTLGTFWQQLGISPEHLSLADLDSGGTGKAELYLGLSYVPKMSDAKCSQQFAAGQRAYNASATALASAYSKLPIRGKSSIEEVEGTNGMLAVKGTQASIKMRVFGDHNDAAYVAYRGTQKAATFEEHFFMYCMVEGAPTPTGPEPEPVAPITPNDRVIEQPDGSYIYGARVDHEQTF